jgi:hypothetical protein
MTDSESKLHLTLWTIAPPLWFFVEFFLFFDNHNSSAAVEQLRASQEVAGRFWAAVLAVMLSYRLADIVKTPQRGN